FRKNTWIYVIEGTFEIDATLSLTTTAKGPAILANITPKPVVTHVYLTPLGWIVGLVGLGIVLATIDVVVLAIALEIARRVSEGPLSGVFTGGITGALGGVPRVFPIGSGPVTFTPTSIALDDLTLGGTISLPTPPSALPNLYISDNLKNPSYEIQLAPQTEGTSRTFQVPVDHRSA